jgi:hypothetical protein
MHEHSWTVDMLDDEYPVVCAVCQVERSETKPCDRCGRSVNADIYEEELGMCVGCSWEYYSDVEYFESEEVNG